MELTIEESFFDLCKSGSKPDIVFDTNTTNFIKEYFITSINIFEKDYYQNKFKNYTAWVSSAGVGIVNIDIAINFILYNEGVH